MSLSTININLINLPSDTLTNISDLLFIIKQPTLNPNPLILISQELTIRYYFSKDTLHKTYYFQLNYSQPNNLSTKNFVIQLPSNIYYVYDYWNSQPNKSLQIFPLYTWVPFVFVGQSYPAQIIVEYSYESVKPPLNQIYTQPQTLCLTTNPYGKSNISNNKLQLGGDVWKINNITITSNDPSITYTLYNIGTPIYLNVGTIIYFVDTSMSLPMYLSIEYLNIYNRNNVIDNKCCDKDMCDKIMPSIPVAFNISDTLSNTKTFIQTLRLTTFDYLKPLNVLNTTNYYNVVFYYLQYSLNGIDGIELFDCDYTKYFNAQTLCTTMVNTFLYQTVCANNPYITVPQILVFDTVQYEFIERTINLNRIFLRNLIEFLCMLNRYYKNIGIIGNGSPNAWNFSNCVEYLNTWTIVPYNVYFIRNVMRSCVRFVETDNKINCTVCKIIFWFGHGFGYGYPYPYPTPSGYYMFDGVMMLSDYSINIYHKNYDLGKKDLVKMLLVLNAMCWGIDIVIGNIDFSNPYVYMNSLSDSFTLFNVIRLRKVNEAFGLDIGANYTDIERLMYSLRLNIQINVPYYLMLFESPMELDYAKMRFVSGMYSFYLNQIVKPNYLVNKNIYVCGFQDLGELNVFVNFLSNGVIGGNKNELSNWFNVLESVCFTNYYLLNDNWVYDPNANASPEPKTQIKFSIINLYVDRIFLHEGCTMDFC